MKRRTVIKAGMAACAGSCLPLGIRADPAPKRRVLILGGTGFIGPHFVQALLDGGHELTLFNRGRSAPGAWADQVTTLIGDRNGDVRSLESGEWDVVIDNSAYLPRQLKLTATLLRPRVPHYLFISTIATYATRKPEGIDENTPLATLDPPDTEDVGRHYGPLKAVCEAELQKIYGDQACFIRPTYIAGPGDRTDRFTYWPVRVSRGGTMLAPGTPDDPLQFIDVRDLADFVRICVEQALTGPFNVCNPPRSTTIGSILETSREMADASTSFTWVSREFLLSHQLLPSPALPLYTDPQGDSAGYALICSDRAQSMGLTFRDLRTTVADTLHWHQQRPEPEQWSRHWLTPEQEAERLREWQAWEKQRG